MTARRFPLGVLLALGGLTLIRLWMAALIPLAPDEAYYWVWSRALAAGYPDHPPMIALWIRLGTMLAGQEPLGIRLLGPLAALLGSLLVYHMALDLLADRTLALRACLLLNATLLFGAGSVTMTPDTPLLFFWTAALWAMARLIETRRPAWWLAVGTACGLALCSKYTAALLPLGILGWLLWARAQRHWLAHPLFWSGAAIGAALFVPTLLWNAHHGWASFVKQGGRNAVFDMARVGSHLGELIAGQAGLVTPLIFVLCIVGVAQAARTSWRDRDPTATLLAMTTLPAAAVFLEHAIGDRVQANWPAIVYPAAVIAAGLPTRPVWTRLVRPAIALGLAMTALVYLQAAAAPFHLSRHLDPTLRLGGGYPALAHDIQAMARQHNARFVAFDEYGAAALQAVLAPACTPVIGIDLRWSLFALPAPILDGQTGLLIRSIRRHDAPSLQDWSSLAPIGTLIRARNGQLADSYVVYQGIARPGPAALLPCPPN